MLMKKQYQCKKKHDCTRHSINDILKELSDFKDQRTAQNVNFNEISKTWRRIGLDAKFFKNECFKAEADNIDQSAIERQLDKLFS